MSPDPRAPGWPPPRADIALVAAVAALELGADHLASLPAGEPDLTWWALLLVAGQTVPLLWRRTYTVAVAALTGLAAAAYGIAELPDAVVPLGPLVALATVVERCPRGRAAAVTAIAAVGVPLSMYLAGDSDGLDYWFGLVLIGLAVVVGEHLRTRRAYLAELEAKVTRTEAERRRDTREAQAAERTRLARELHDVVAHNVSMMVVQAEAGASVATDERSVEGFDGIAATGRHALTELRRLLGVLRTDEPATPVAPQPGVERLAELVAQVAGTGLDAELVVDGDVRALPVAVDLSVYRIVQEGLTNVIKHADAARVTVTVRYHDRGVAVVVQDDGSGRPAGVEGGFGITGLKERVDLLEGTLDAGPCIAGGYALRVELPAP